MPPSNQAALKGESSKSLPTPSSPFSGEVEVDESYFGARRVRGLRGRGARGKTIVFGLLKRHGKIYTEIVPDCSMATLQGIIRGKVSLESVIHSDGWRGYNGLVDLGCQKHFRVEHAIMNLPPSTHISTVLKASGHLQKRDLCALGAWQNTLFTFI